MAQFRRTRGAIADCFFAGHRPRGDDREGAAAAVEAGLRILGFTRMKKLEPDSEA